MFSLLTTDARCLLIKLGGQCVIVDFALTSVAWSIGVSRDMLVLDGLHSAEKYST